MDADFGEFGNDSRERAMIRSTRRFSAFLVCAGGLAIGLLRWFRPGLGGSGDVRGQPFHRGRRCGRQAPKPKARAMRSRRPPPRQGSRVRPNLGRPRVGVEHTLLGTLDLPTAGSWKHRRDPTVVRNHGTLGATDCRKARKERTSSRRMTAVSSPARGFCRACGGKQPQPVPPEDGERGSNGYSGVSWIGTCSFRGTKMTQSDANTPSWALTLYPRPNSFSDWSLFLNTITICLSLGPTQK